MSTTILHEDSRGRIVAEGNELIIEDKTSGDPVAIRYRSNNETKGKLSIDKYVNGAWRELGLVQYKEDERGRTDPAHADALEVEFWSHIPGRDFEDPSYERIFSIRHDGVIFHKGLPSAAPNVLRSTNGRVVLAAQDDGNLVLYVDNAPVRALFGLPEGQLW